MDFLINYNKVNCCFNYYDKQVLLGYNFLNIKDRDEEFIAILIVIIKLGFLREGRCNKNWFCAFEEELQKEVKNIRKKFPNKLKLINAFIDIKNLIK
jgi:hypothetical protein